MRGSDSCRTKTSHLCGLSKNFQDFEYVFRATHQRHESFQSQKKVDMSKPMSASGGQDKLSTSRKLLPLPPQISQNFLVPQKGICTLCKSHPLKRFPKRCDFSPPIFERRRSSCNNVKSNKTMEKVLPEPIETKNNTRGEPGAMVQLSLCLRDFDPASGSWNWWDADYVQNNAVRKRAHDSGIEASGTKLTGWAGPAGLG